MIPGVRINFSQGSLYLHLWRFLGKGATHTPPPRQGLGTTWHITRWVSEFLSRSISSIQTFCDLASHIYQILMRVPRWRDGHLGKYLWLFERETVGNKKWNLFEICPYCSMWAYIKTGRRHMAQDNFGTPLDPPKRLWKIPKSKGTKKVAQINCHAKGWKRMEKKRETTIASRKKKKKNNKWIRNKKKIDISLPTPTKKGKKNNSNSSREIKIIKIILILIKRNKKM